jgi:hypothetical protein
MMVMSDRHIYNSRVALKTPQVSLSVDKQACLLINKLVCRQTGLSVDKQGLQIFQSRLQSGLKNLYDEVTGVFGTILKINIRNTDAGHCFKN